MRDGMLVEAARPEHAFLLAPMLCEEDRSELHELGQGAVYALDYSIRNSSEAWTLTMFGEPAACLGVVPRFWGGQFWLLTTPAVRKHPRGLVKLGHAVVPRLASQFGLLANLIDGRHAAALRLAAHFDFVVTPDYWRSPRGVSFSRITLEAPRVHGN